MSINEIGTKWDRNNRNVMNDNDTVLDQKINEQKQRVNTLITEVEQPSEVVDARGGFPVLRDKLQNTDEQLAQKAQQSYAESAHKRIDNLAIPIGEENSNIQVTDALVSVSKNKTFNSLTKRFEDVEKDAYIPSNSILINGDFSENLNGWTNTSPQAVTTIVENNEVTVTTTNTNGLQQTINFKLGHKYYVGGSYRTLSGSGGRIRFQTTGFTILFELPQSTTTLTRYSDIYTANSTQDVVVYLRVPTSSVLFKGLTVLDLTEIFGAGNEPTKQGIDELFNTSAGGKSDGRISNAMMTLNAFKWASENINEPFNLKMQLFGDSITDNTWWSNPSWVDYINDNLSGNITVLNNAIGGSKLSKDGVRTDSMVELVTGGTTLNNDNNVVVVFGGTNDWSTNQQLGTFLSDDINTVYGAVKKIIETTVTTDALLIFATPLKRNHTSDANRDINSEGLKVNANNDTLNDFCNAITRTCEWYGIPYVDLNKDIGINELNVTRFTSDGLHPYGNGNKLNKRIASVICNYVKNYY